MQANPQQAYFDDRYHEILDALQNDPGFLISILEQALAHMAAATLVQLECGEIINEQQELYPGRRIASAA